MADEKAKLHFVRVRKPGEPGFLDPQTDIRSIVPDVCEAALARLEDECEGRPEAQEFDYLRQCFRVFRIRVLEDPAGVDAQVTEFLDAVDKVRADTRDAWFRRVVCALLCVYALFCRRDSAADRDTLEAMLDSTYATTLKELLPPDVHAVVMGHLRKRLAPLLRGTKPRGSGAVVCAETGEEIDRVKDIAAAFIGASGADDWNSKAALCDAEFSTPGRKSDGQLVALALAYPNYRQLNLMVEVEKDGSDPKTEEPAAPEQPGAV